MDMYNLIETYFMVVQGLTLILSVSARVMCPETFTFLGLRSTACRRCSL